MRIDFKNTAPDTFKLLMDCEKHTHTNGLDPQLVMLVKIRTSQLNGCAHCIDMHTKEARKLGEKEERIYALNAWRESDYFDLKEQAALEFAEAVTLLDLSSINDDLFDLLKNHFTENEILELLFTINTMNSWNRVFIALSHRSTPGIWD